MRRMLALAVAVAALALFQQPAFGAAFKFTSGVASGDVTPTSAVLWGRTNQAAAVTLQVSTNANFTNIVKTANANSTAARNFTVERTVTRLSRNTTYYFRFVGPGGVRSAVGRFRTAPGSGSAADLLFAFSGDSDGTKTAAGTDNFRDNVAAVLESAQKEGLDFFVWLGDTMYADSDLDPTPATTLAGYRGKHREVRSIARVRNFLKSVPVVAQWDDHEVVDNYAGDLASAVPAPFPPGLTVGQVNDGQRAFNEYWPIRNGPGGVTYRKFTWGAEVEIAVLDQRSYRTSPLAALAACDTDPGPALVPDVAPTAPQPIRTQFAALPGLAYLAMPAPAACTAAINSPTATLLGATQRSWLESALTNSTARVFFILSEVPIQEFYANPYDRWEGYAFERLHLLDYIGDPANSVDPTVVFLSADTHATLVNEICRTSFPCVSTGMMEVVTGPMGTNTFAAEIDAAFPVPPPTPPTSALVGLFFSAPAPNGLAMDCVNLNQDTYATVEYDAQTNTVTITPKAPLPGLPGGAICAAPAVIPV